MFCHLSQLERQLQGLDGIVTAHDWTTSALFYLPSNAAQWAGHSEQIVMARRMRLTTWIPRLQDEIQQMKEALASAILDLARVCFAAVPQYN